MFDMKINVWYKSSAFVKGTQVTQRLPKYILKENLTIKKVVKNNIDLYIICRITNTVLIIALQ